VVSSFKVRRTVLATVQTAKLEKIFPKYAF